MFKKKGKTTNNTLYNYFSKTPEAVKTVPRINVEEKENLKKNKDGTNKKDDIPGSTGEEHNVKKRRRLLIEEEDSIEEEEQNESSLFEGAESDDFKPSEEESDSESSEGCPESEVEVSSPSSESDEDLITSMKKKKINNHDEQKRKKLKLDRTVPGETFMEKLENLKADADNFGQSEKKMNKIANIITNPLVEQTIWPHQKLEFLQPGNIRDKKKRRPDHKDYDPNTLFVPEDYISKCSPGVRQWWIMKSENFQCVLFFKVGKFYELYHMDADVGVKELGFNYMKGEFAHSGFPEISYDKMSSILIDRGYKVARVEQTETPDMMQERCRQSNPSKVEKKKDKVVRREICQISCRGSQIFGSQCQINPSYRPNYMMAIVEKDERICSRYGISFIDTSIGDFYLSEFIDDDNCSRFLTLVSHNMPVLVIYQNHSLSERTQQIMRTSLSTVMKEALPSKSNNSSAESTLKILAEKYFCTTENKNDWPITLKNMLSHSEHSVLIPNEDYRLALQALGLTISYLSKCVLEEKVLPIARYHLYVPPDLQSDTDFKSIQSTNDSKPSRPNMVLDAATLSNLRVIGDENSLFATLNNCCTKFGQRVLHTWLCSPSCNIEEIKHRQDAIAELLAHPKEIEQIRPVLAIIPDLERYISQIQMLGSKRVSDDHPDGRAVLFEEKLYNRRKIKNFTATLNGFEEFLKVCPILSEFESPLIKRITQPPDAGGCFPDIRSILDFFKNSFDHEEAVKTGVIVLKKGVDKDLDECDSKLNAIRESLNEYLAEQENFFGCRVKFFGSDKKRYQLEVPETHAKSATADYFLESQTKGKNPVRRYYTDEAKEFLKKTIEAEEERNTVLKDITRRIFEKFSNHYNVWKKGIDCIAYLDVLISLTEYARNQSVICIPEVHDFNETPFLQIEEGYHPCVKKGSYIPNGVTLGTAGIPALSLLTGPNMGGKSTLMRQLGCLVVMAQIGAHVPAETCRLSVVDRIFTRLGAHDDILSAQSTFLVELNETSLILKHASKHSLVLLDELGRGTATYDGTAIAASVVKFLVELKSRTLFSTHYHSLVDYYRKYEHVYLGHMACMVENEDLDDPTQENIIFLYKYSPGACPKSYGFNAAKLSGMYLPIVKRAYELSKQVEAAALKRKIAGKIIRSLIGDVDYTSIKNLYLQLKN